MKKIKNTFFISAIVVAFMFSFSYMLVPLYDIFCEITGLNGKTNNERIVNIQEAESDRYVNVKFTSTVAGSEPFIFAPNERQMRVKVGKIYTTHYNLTNKSTSIKNVTASPSVVPGKDADRDQMNCQANHHLLE